MLKSILAMLVGASLLCFGILPAHATTSVPFGSYQGTWSRTPTYAAGSVVTYNGGTYFAVISNHNAIPATHPAAWNLLPSLPRAEATGTGSAVSGLASGAGTLILSVQVPVAGEYIFNATAQVYADVDDAGVFCYVTYGVRGAVSDGIEGGISNPFTTVSLEGTAAVADFWVLTADDDAQLYCYSVNGDANSEVLSAGLTVTLTTDPTKPDTDAATAEINNKPEVHVTHSVDKHRQ